MIVKTKKLEQSKFDWINFTKTKNSKRLSIDVDKLDRDEAKEIINILLLHI